HALRDFVDRNRLPARLLSGRLFPVALEARARRRSFRERVPVRPDRREIDAVRESDRENDRRRDLEPTQAADGHSRRRVTSNVGITPTTLEKIRQVPEIASLR